MQWSPLLRRQASRPAAKAPPARPTRPVFDVQAMRSAVTPQQISTEETKVRQVEESIRVFVRVADPKFRQVVPMRFFNLTLTPAEADACSADYLEEKSPRGSVARVLLRIVAVVARMTTEMEELKRAENAPSLWKLHADSLLALLEVASALSENAARVAGKPAPRVTARRRDHQSVAAEAPSPLRSDWRTLSLAESQAADGVNSHLLRL